MPYYVKRIAGVEQIDQCDVFQIDHYQWLGSYRPKAYGSMGYREGYGLIVSITVEEKNPLRHYQHRDDPVYKDSAVEAFFDFSPKSGKQKYFNFEMNGNGAMLSQFGNRGNRQFLKHLTNQSARCDVAIKERSWSAILQIPMELITELYQMKPLEKEDRFTCNFYKICEDPGLEHYASYAPIDSPSPDFHLPEYFTEAVIC